jgi:hypothetical protein
MTTQNEPAQPIYQLHDGEVAEPIEIKVAGWPGLTAREHAALVLRVPDSGEPWLDDMIRRARRSEYIKAVMQGLCTVECGGANEFITAVINMADACLAAEQEGK